jgi:hypothetical protein
MKKYLFTLSLSLAAATTFAQGLVNFYNTPTTLVSAVAGPGGAATAINRPPGAYYFALLISASYSLQGPWVSSGLYATNLATAGMFSGGAGVAVPGLAPGQLFYYKVFGWSTNMGHDYNPGWEIGSGFPPGYFNPFAGESAFGVGVAGGTTGNSTLPALDLFGTNGINTGFTLFKFDDLVPLPGLWIVHAGDNVIVTWSPPPAEGLTLQSTTNLDSPTAWTPVSPAPSVQGILTNRISGTQQFFRFSQ